MIGKISTYANINPAKFYILPAKELVCANIPRLMILNRTSGTNIVVTAEHGFLNKAI